MLLQRVHSLPTIQFSTHHVLLRLTWFCQSAYRLTTQHNTHYSHYLNSAKIYLLMTSQCYGGGS